MSCLRLGDLRDRRWSFGARDGGAHRIDPGAASMAEVVQTSGNDPIRPMAALAPFRLESSYARDLQGFSVPWRPQAAPAPKSLFFNAPLATMAAVTRDVASGS